jgi:hypothetical protein
MPLVTEHTPVYFQSKYVFQRPWLSRQRGITLRYPSYIHGGQCAKGVFLRLSWTRKSRKIRL